MYDDIEFAYGELGLGDVDAASNGNEYIIYTTRDIGKTTAQKLGQVDGVERVFVISRYTIRIVIGKMFDDQEVLKAVAKTWGLWHKEL